jgi:hypothetical protein
MQIKGRGEEMAEAVLRKEIITWTFLKKSYKIVLSN